MTYPAPGNDGNDPTAGPYGYPTPPVTDYGAQPAAGYAGQPPTDHLPQPYGSAYPQPYGYGYPPPMATRPTNGVAIASLVVSCAAVLGLCAYGLGGYLGIVGAVLGHVGRRQIRERGDGGEGLALAGVIVGWLATAIAVIATVLIVFFVVWASRQDGGTAPTPFETF